MYSFFLDLHNVLRWVVLLLGAAALLMAWAGALGRGKWTPGLSRVSRIFSVAVDVQVLVGLVLYVALSPLTRTAFRDFGAAMRSSEQRFFLVEHSLLMILSAALVHVGAARGRKLDSPLQAAIFYSLAAVAMAFAIPWWRRLVPGL